MDAKLYYRNNQTVSPQPPHPCSMILRTTSSPTPISLAISLTMASSSTSTVFFGEGSKLLRISEVWRVGVEGTRCGVEGSCERKRGGDVVWSRVGERR